MNRSKTEVNKTMKTLALLLAVFLPTITFADEDFNLNGEIHASLAGENQSIQDDEIGRAHV